MQVPMFTNSWTGKTVYITEISNCTLTYCGYIPHDQYTADTTKQEYIPGLLEDEEEES